MRSSANWALYIRPKAHKALGRMPDHDRRRILSVIEMLPNDWVAGDTQKIQGEENQWRRRIGAYRVFYEIMPLDRVIAILRVERRASKTYGKQK